MRAPVVLASLLPLVALGGGLVAAGRRQASSDSSSPTAASPITTLKPKSGNFSIATISPLVGGTSRAPARSSLIFSSAISRASRQLRAWVASMSAVVRMPM